MRGHCIRISEAVASIQGKANNALLYLFHIVYVCKSIWIDNGIFLCFIPSISTESVTNKQYSWRQIQWQSGKKSETETIKINYKQYEQKQLIVNEWWYSIMLQSSLSLYPSPTDNAKVVNKCWPNTIHYICIYLLVSDFNFNIHNIWPDTHTYPLELCW